MQLQPPPAFNMAAFVLAQAAARGAHPALEVLGGGPRLTFAALEQAVRGTATGLLSLGLVPGDRVLLRLGNTPDFPIAYLGAIAAGLIPVPTSAQLTGPEITGIAATLDPALVLAAPGIALPDHPAPVCDSDRLAGFRALPPAAYALGAPDRPAYIVYTSGTSGRARAVVHAHRAIWARRMMWDGWYGLRASDRLLHAGAFNWTYTLGTGLMDPWAIGATALIPAPDTPATALPALLADHRATIFAAAPGVYRRLLRVQMPRLPALRHGLSAGEKLPEPLRRRWTAATGTPVHEAFGMSECSTFISGSPARPAPPGTLGYPQPGRRVALLTDGAPVADDTPGTIAIHRDDPGLMLGYLDQPAETAARFAGDWFLTGDVGLRDSSGAIAYAGRADDMMNAGGYRVSPVEVEQALAAHPAITEVACAEVRATPDTSLIAAFFVTHGDVTGDDLRAFASRSLAAYKVPRLYVPVADLPRGANNKLLRRKLRQDWEAQHGQA